MNRYLPSAALQRREIALEGLCLVRAGDLPCARRRAARPCASAPAHACGPWKQTSSCPMGYCRGEVRQEGIATGVAFAF